MVAPPPSVIRTAYLFRMLDIHRKLAMGTFILPNRKIKVQPADRGEPLPDKKPFETDEVEGFWSRKLHQLGSELSVSGLKYVSSNSEPSLRRFIWSILIVGGLTFMSWQVVNSFILFYKRPTQVRNSLQNSK